LPARRTPVPTCDVTKTRSPETIGDETPTPPMAAFHATFSVALQRTGRFFSSEAPVPRGPRHCGQSAAAAVDPPSATTSAIVIV
jgi:hypothetical protein